jgi:hypothetical protein
VPRQRAPLAGFNSAQNFFMDDILSDPSTAYYADSAANTGDGSAVFDDNTTTGAISDSSTQQGSSWLSGLWGAISPAVTTAAGAAAATAAGALATQAKTANTANKAASGPAPAGAPGTIGGFSVNTIIYAVIGILVAVLLLGRRKGK